MSITVTESQIKHKINFDEIKTQVKKLMNDDISPDYVICSWNNTKLNLMSLDKFVQNIEVDHAQYLIAKVAFYFLYTGRTINFDELISNSKKIARQFLESHFYPASFIDEVMNCLDAYKYENKKENQATELIQDITHRYIGKKNFILYLRELWNERNILRKSKVDFTTFLENKYVEINQHEFRTEYAKKRYEDRKIRNVEKLQHEIQSIKNSNSLNSNKRAMTMFRTALRNHIDLVNIADKKAGIMISINAIIMTLMIPILGSYILDISRFIVPSIILITTCGITVILATLATRPQIPNGDSRYEEIVKGEKSLWYFGNFFKMGKEKYQKAIKEVIVKEISFENSVISDLYDLGHVLGVKYQRLRWCYMVFAVGMGLTLITFGISFLRIPEL